MICLIYCRGGKLPREWLFWIFRKGTEFDVSNFSQDLPRHIQRLIFVICNFLVIFFHAWKIKCWMPVEHDELRQFQEFFLRKKCAIFSMGNCWKWNIDSFFARSVTPSLCWTFQNFFVYNRSPDIRQCSTTDEECYLNRDTNYPACYSDLDIFFRHSIRILSHTMLMRLPHTYVEKKTFGLCFRTSDSNDSSVPGIRSVRETFSLRNGMQNMYSHFHRRNGDVNLWMKTQTLRKSVACYAVVRKSHGVKCQKGNLQSGKRP